MSDESIKDALKLIPYGFYAISSKSDADTNIMVANWVTQVSFSPRLVAFGLQKSSHSHSVIEDGRVFAINIFNSGDQEATMGLTKGRAKNPDKVKDANYSDAPVTGCPIVKDASAYIEFKVKDIIDIGGDHDIVVGEAVGGGILKPIESGDVLNLPQMGWSYAG